MRAASRKTHDEGHEETQRKEKYIFLMPTEIGCSE